MYFEARYLSTDSGRFMSKDPVHLDATAAAFFKDPQAQNAYAYSRNNPINLYDPNGEWPTLRQWNSFAEKALKVEKFVGNLMTFGTYGDALDNAGTAGQRMADEGVNVKTVSNTALQITAGTVIAGGSALITGVTVGEGYMIVAGVLNERNIVFQLGNASGKTVNGTTTIPKDWTVGPSDRGGGFKYTNPINTNENIRLMPGNPKSRFSNSQVPYYRHQVDGRYLDTSNKINSNNAVTHFPINEIK